MDEKTKRTRRNLLHASPAVRRSALCGVEARHVCFGLNCSLRGKWSALGRVTKRVASEYTFRDSGRERILSNAGTTVLRSRYEYKALLEIGRSVLHPLSVEKFCQGLLKHSLIMSCRRVNIFRRDLYSLQADYSAVPLISYKQDIFLLNFSCCEALRALKNSLNERMVC